MRQTDKRKESSITPQRTKKLPDSLLWTLFVRDRGYIIKRGLVKLGGMNKRMQRTLQHPHLAVDCTF